MNSFSSFSNSSRESAILILTGSRDSAMHWMASPNLVPVAFQGFLMDAKVIALAGASSSSERGNFS